MDLTIKSLVLPASSGEVTDARTMIAENITITTIVENITKDVAKEVIKTEIIGTIVTTTTAETTNQESQEFNTTP
jgi:hypothetical protein